MNILHKKKADYNMYEGMRVFSRVIGWAATFSRITTYLNRYFLLDINNQQEVVIKEFLPEEVELRTLIAIPNFQLRIFDLHGKLFIYDGILYISTGQKVYEVRFNIKNEEEIIKNSVIQHDKDINNLSRHIEETTEQDVIYNKSTQVALVLTHILKPADYYNFTYQQEIFTYTIFFGQKVSIILPRYGRDQFFIKLSPDQMFLTYFDHKLLIISNYNQTKFRVINLTQRKYIDVNNIHYDMEFVVQFRQGSIRNLLEISVNNHLTLQQTFMDKFKEIREAGTNMSFFSSHVLQFQQKIAENLGQSILTRSNTEVDLVPRIQNNSTLLLQDLEKDQRKFQQPDLSQLQSVSTIFGKENEITDSDLIDNSKAEQQNKSNIQNSGKKNVMIYQNDNQKQQFSQNENDALSRVESQLSRLAGLIEQLIQSKVTEKQENERPEAVTVKQITKQTSQVIEQPVKDVLEEQIKQQQKQSPLCDTSDIQFVLSQEFDVQKDQNINPIYRSSTGILCQDIDINLSEQLDQKQQQQAQQNNEQLEDENASSQNTVQRFENQSDTDTQQHHYHVQLKSVDSLTTDSEDTNYILSFTELNKIEVQNQQNDVQTRVSAIEGRLDQQGQQLNIIQEQMQTILSLLQQKNSKQDDQQRL